MTINRRVRRNPDSFLLIISEEEYSRLNQNMRITSYADAFKKRGLPTRSKTQANSLIDDNLEKVKHILLELYIQPEIFPTALQTIQLEFMDNTFQIDEKLYRAIYPPEVVEMFLRKDGTISSAAFADPKGLSVDRGDYREDEVVVEDLKRRLVGRIISLYVKSCYDIGAVVLLSKPQRLYLARKARMIQE